MSESSQSAVERLQRAASALDRLVDDVMRSAPRRSEATDSSTVVRVVLDSDGLPESFEVGVDWRRAVGAEKFGAAVNEACRAAEEERRSAWSRELQHADGRLEPADRSSGTGDDPADRSWQRRNGAAALLPPQPDAFTAVRSRPVAAVTDDILATLSQAVNELDTASAGPVQATGSAAGGRLSLTISGNGDVSCDADAAWVSQQETADLAEALNRALARARAELAATPSTTDSTVRLDALFEEALAALRDLEDLP